MRKSQKEAGTKAQQRLVALLSEVVALARTIAPQAIGLPRSDAVTAVARGIYPHKSKYNPWRAYVWSSLERRTVYLGAFPSVAKAKQAQKAWRAGAPVTAGTKAPMHLRRVA